MFKIAFDIGKLIYLSENYPSHYAQDGILSGIAKRLVYDEKQLDAIIAGYVSQSKVEKFGLEPVTEEKANLIIQNYL